MDIIIIIVMMLICCCCCCCIVGGGYYYIKYIAPKNTQGLQSSSDNIYSPSSSNNTSAPTTTTPVPVSLPPISTTAVNISTPMGQINNTNIYFKELTVVDNPAGGVDVYINAPLQIYHNLTIPGKWGAGITTNIDTNWNITVTYAAADRWPRHEYDVYGMIKIETFLESNTKIEELKTKCNICKGNPDKLGDYYQIRTGTPKDSSNPQQENITINQMNNSRKLTFKNKNSLVKISAYIAAYDGNTKLTDYGINISDTIKFSTTNNSAENL